MRKRNTGRKTSATIRASPARDAASGGGGMLLFHVFISLKLPLGGCCEMEKKEKKNP